MALPNAAHDETPVGVIRRAVKIARLRLKGTHDEPQAPSLRPWTAQSLRSDFLLQYRFSDSDA